MIQSFVRSFTRVFVRFVKILFLSLSCLWASCFMRGDFNVCLECLCEYVDIGGLEGVVHERDEVVLAYTFEDCYKAVQRDFLRAFWLLDASEEEPRD